MYRRSYFIWSPVIACASIQGQICQCSLYGSHREEARGSPAPRLPLCRSRAWRRCASTAPASSPRHRSPAAAHTIRAHKSGEHGGRRQHKRRLMCQRHDLNRRHVYIYLYIAVYAHTIHTNHTARTVGGHQHRLSLML